MELIPVFPNFRSLELKDKKIFDDYFKLVQPQISEYTFANLYVWRNTLNVQISLLYENICVQMNDFHGTKIFAPFIGGQLLKAAIDACLNYAKREWKDVTFGLFTQEQLEVFKLYYPTANIALDRDASDYLYKVTDLIALRGKKYDGKRNHIKRFKKEFPYTYETMEAKHLDGCHQLLEKWYHQHCDTWHCSLNLRSETEACREALKNYKALGLVGGIIDVNKQIVAFSLGEELNKETAVIHFEKSDQDFPGLPSVINNEYVSHEWADYPLVNREEDLGEPGLRVSKLSYNPVQILDKYYITFGGGLK